MKNRDSYLELLRKYIDRLNTSQFDALMSSSLSPSEQDDLTKPKTKDSFIEDMERWGLLKKVEEVILTRWPAIMSGFEDELEKIKEIPQPDVIDNTLCEVNGVVHFVNRRYELELLGKPTCPKYVLLDAPAGYGKTFLLWKLANVYNKPPSQICLFIDFEKESITCRQNPTDLIRAMLQKTESQKGNGLKDLSDLINALAATLAEPKRQEVLFLFDSFDLVQADPRSLIGSWIWSEFIPSFENRLRALNIGIRVIFSGRYISDEWKGARRYLLHTSPLTPFDERVVLDAIQELYGNGNHLDQDRALSIAREVVDITGGHPECIMLVLKRIADYHFAINLDNQSPDYFFTGKQREKLFSEYVEPTIDIILRGVDNTTKDAMAIVSVFRRFNAETLDALIYNKYIQWDGQPIHLLASLMRTHLVHRPNADDPFYSDNVARLMLASKLKILSKDTYLKINQLALDIFNRWSKGVDRDGNNLPHKPTDVLQVYFVIESLYHLCEILLLEQRSPEQATDKLTRYLSEQLIILDSTFGESNLASVGMQLADTIGRRDEELRNKIIRVAGDGGYVKLLTLLEEFISKIDR